MCVPAAPPRSRHHQASPLRGAAACAWRRPPAQQRVQTNVDQLVGHCCRMHADGAACQAQDTGTACRHRSTRKLCAGIPGAPSGWRPTAGRPSGPHQRRRSVPLQLCQKIRPGSDRHGTKPAYASAASAASSALRSGISDDTRCGRPRRHAWSGVCQASGLNHDGVEPASQARRKEQHRACPQCRGRLIMAGHPAQPARDLQRAVAVPGWLSHLFLRLSSLVRMRMRSPRTAEVEGEANSLF